MRNLAGEARGKSETNHGLRFVKTPSEINPIDARHGNVYQGQRYSGLQLSQAIKTGQNDTDLISQRFQIFTGGSGDCFIVVDNENGVVHSLKINKVVPSVSDRHHIFFSTDSKSCFF